MNSTVAKTISRSVGEEASSPLRLSWPVGAVPLAWAGAAAAVLLWPDIVETDYTREFGILVAGLAILFTLIGLLTTIPAVTASRPGPLFARYTAFAPWLLVLGLALFAWEAVTAKLGFLPRPFFVAPQEMFGVYVDDWAKLLECTFRSALLLATGYAIGVAVGFTVGVSVGWSRAVAYWGHPILRVIGPLPATAWLPIAFFAFPSSHSAAVFLVALASGLPVAILTWSGVSSVASAYYDIARTLGANQRFLVLKVAIPAAMPNVFVGLFMGLCAAFAVLVVAEMMGVKAGLGWYLQWAQGWAAYGNMYAALAVLAVLCSSLVTALFRLRGRLLSWQKGLLRW